MANLTAKTWVSIRPRARAPVAGVGVMSPFDLVIHVSIAPRPIAHSWQSMSAHEGPPLGLDVAEQALGLRLINGGARPAEAAARSRTLQMNLGVEQLVHVASA